MAKKNSMPDSLREQLNATPFPSNNDVPVVSDVDKAKAVLAQEEQRKTQDCARRLNELLQECDRALVVSGFDLTDGRLIPKLDLAIVQRKT